MTVKNKNTNAKEQLIVQFVDTAVTWGVFTTYYTSCARFLFLFFNKIDIFFTFCLYSMAKKDSDIGAQWFSFCCFYFNVKLNGCSRKIFYCVFVVICSQFRLIFCTDTDIVIHMLACLLVSLFIHILYIYIYIVFTCELI